MRVGVAALLVATSAAAGPDEVVVLPTALATPPPPSRPRRPEPDERLERARRELDLVLGEAVQDLGLTLDVSHRPKGEGPRGEAELVARASDTWVISPEIALDRGEVDLKLAVVAPDSSVVLVRRERVAPDDLDVEAMKMLRDLIQTGRGATAAPEPTLPTPAPGEPVTRAKSPGRAVLALNGAAFGGYVGYSVQRASGSSDVRLTYPLTALGTGVGLGASMIVADEWDVGVGDAWYLAAGMWWPGAGALLLADGYDVRPVEDRFMYGMLGAASGLALATTSLSLGHVDAGGASLTHSGGAFGALLGGIVEAAVQGDLVGTPTKGMGYGAIGGVAVAGVAATQIDVNPSRILFIDLIAGLGGLVGAAVGSPLIVGEEATDAETRGWLASVAGGIVAGATVGMLVTNPRTTDTSQRAPRWAARPYGGTIAPALGPEATAAFGIGVQGEW
jgi:hypothetical protein